MSNSSSLVPISLIAPPPSSPPTARHARAIPIDSRANGAGLPKTRKRGQIGERAGRAIW